MVGIRQGQAQQHAGAAAQMQLGTLGTFQQGDGIDGLRLTTGVRQSGHF